MALPMVAPVWPCFICPKPSLWGVCPAPSLFGNSDFWEDDVNESLTSSSQKSLFRGPAGGAANTPRGPHVGQTRHIRAHAAIGDKKALEMGGQNINIYIGTLRLSRATEGSSEKAPKTILNGAIAAPSVGIRQ